MGPLRSIVSAYQHWNDFSGRSTRPQFWWFFFYFFAIGVSLAAIEMNVLWAEDAFLSRLLPLTELFSLLNLVPSLSLMTRRIRDTGIDSSLWLKVAIAVTILGYILTTIEVVSIDPTAYAGTAYIVSNMITLIFPIVVAVLAMRRTSPDIGSPGPNPTEVTP